MVEASPPSRLLTAFLDACLPRACLNCGAALAAAPPRGAGRRTAATPLAACGSHLCGACLSGLIPLGEPRCRRCGRGLISEEALCLGCRGRSSALDSVRPLFPLEGAAAALIRGLKFDGLPSLADPMAGLLAEAIVAQSSADFTLVPVPPRPGKLRREGRDQVEDLARALARRGFLVERPLRRLAGAEQKRLDREGRLGNARRCYVLAPGRRAPVRALILDDVMTTGATLEACAEALAAGGAREIRAFAFAAEL